MEVVQVDDAHLWRRGRSEEEEEEEAALEGAPGTTRRNAAGMKIFVKRTGTENFSSPTSSNLETRERWRR